jgi:hypothetical protein
MKVAEELPREVYLKQVESLQNVVNPKPYTAKQIAKIKKQKLSKQTR